MELSISAYLDAERDELASACGSSTFGDSHGPAQGPVFGDVSDLVILHREHLIPLIIGVDIERPPLQVHHEAVSHCRGNLGARLHVRSQNSFTVLEDRPGLIRAVSRGCVSPPQMTAL
jgi:hypothetical protein